MGQLDKNHDQIVLAGGDLGSQRRTIGGLLGQLEIAELDEAASIDILKRVGLPAQAYHEPGFPISLEQDFRILTAVRRHFPGSVSLLTTVFLLIERIQIHQFGILGLAMQSAPTNLDAIQVPITYPQMNWGRCRLFVKRSPSADSIVYELDRNRLPPDTPEEMVKTHTHSMALDMAGSIAILYGVSADPGPIKRMTLPFARPDDWQLVDAGVDFSTEFEAEEAALVFPTSFFDEEPKNAHPLSYKAAMHMVEREASMLAEEISVGDRVRRWLWAYAPPLKKAQIANLLGMSERSLTRQLSRDGTTYNRLFAEVQSERAINLLSNEDLTISEVGYRLGYAEPAAFSRAFTSWNKISPSRWREKQPNRLPN